MLDSRCFYKSPHFIFFYPTIEDLEDAIRSPHGYFTGDAGGFILSDIDNEDSPGDNRGQAFSELEHIRKVFNLKVNIIEPQEIFFTIADSVTLDSDRGSDKIEQPVMQIIFGDKIGWILPRSWMSFETMKIKKNV